MVSRLLIAVLPLVPALHAQGRDYIKANYTKYEYLVPMRDGKRLFTQVYAPKDISKSYPFLLVRTPYSCAPYGEDSYRDGFRVSEKFAKEGYLFVYQDVRGRYLSEGEFVNMRPHIPVKRGKQDVDESTDTYDTIEWLIHNIPHNNGRAGILGISYPGFYAAMGLIDAHPALKAASPQAPISDWFIGDDFHHNGALYLNHMFRFFSGFGKPRPEPVKKSPPAIESDFVDSYDFMLRLGPLANINERVFKNEIPFWTEMTKHPDYDEYWQARNIRPHLKNVTPAVLTVGGWFDAEDLFGALEVYKSVGRQSPGANNRLVMGPWYHGGWSGSDGDRLGDVRFNAKTSQFYREEVEFPFFEHYLKDKADPKLPAALVFETGSNQWRRYDVWPPKQGQAKSLFLHAGGKLSFSPPSESDSFSEYPSDPAKPVPFASSTEARMTREHMVADQRFAASRPDVLVFESDPLEDNVTLAGPLTALLHVSTTGTDSDFVVKLIDVYPNDFPAVDPNPGNVTMGGYQQLLRGELMRGRYRNSYQKPEPFVPGKAEKIEYTLPDIYHNFRRGHRIMIQIQSSWFPLVDRNPQKFVDVYSAKADDFRKATQKVFHSSGQPSQLKVLVLPR